MFEKFLRHVAEHAPTKARLSPEQIEQSCKVAPPPRTAAELNDTCFVVKDSKGRQLANVYFGMNRGDDQQPSCSRRRGAAQERKGIDARDWRDVVDKIARRIAANVAKLLH